MTPATITEAREYLKANLTVGVPCPCCRQFVKRYRRKLNSSMARSLIAIYAHYEFFRLERRDEEWLHVPSYLHKLQLNATNEAGLLRHWGLIVEKPTEKDDGNPCAGFYRITPRGREFVNAEVNVEKYAFLYNQRLLGFGPERLSILDALGDRFHYADLMKEWK